MADKPRARPTQAPRAVRAPGPVPLAKVKKLAAALERDETEAAIPEQIQALRSHLAELGDRAPAAAAAALARTARGSAVARAYLEVLAADGADPHPAADTVARYCAAMTRGRKLLRPAFLATWHRAADAAALEAAWKNLARIAIDDPALLTVAIEAARRLGHTAQLAERTAQLARAERLA